MLPFPSLSHSCLLALYVWRYGTTHDNCELSDESTHTFLRLNNPSHFETDGTSDYYERGGGRDMDDSCLEGKNWVTGVVRLLGIFHNSSTTTQWYWKFCIKMSCVRVSIVPILRNERETHHYHITQQRAAVSAAKMETHQHLTRILYNSAVQYSAYRSMD